MNSTSQKKGITSQSVPVRRTFSTESCHCRHASGVLDVQLCGMEDVGCQATCMTAHPDSPATFVGLSSGRLLNVTVTSETSSAEQNAVKSTQASSTGDDGISTSSHAALQISHLSHPHAAAITSVQPSSDGSLLASLSGANGQVRIWRCSPKTGSEITMLATQNVAGAFCAAWLPVLGDALLPRLLVGCVTCQLVVSLQP